MSERKPTSFIPFEATAEIMAQDGHTAKYAKTIFPHATDEEMRKLVALVTGDIHDAFLSGMGYGPIQSPGDIAEAYSAGYSAGVQETSDDE